METTVSQCLVQANAYLRSLFHDTMVLKLNVLKPGERETPKGGRLIRKKLKEKEGKLRIH